MISDPHQQAEHLAGQAAQAMIHGDLHEARQLYSDAALFEATALQGINRAEKPRTFGIISVSTVALFFKAGHYREAEQSALQSLSSQELPSFAKDQLRSLLENIWDAETQYSSNLPGNWSSIQVTLRGQEVGYGSAPVDLFKAQVGGIESLVTRIAEYLLKKPFRTSGPPPSDLGRMFKAVVSTPRAGSFKFNIRLEASQLPLFDDMSISPRMITGQLYSLVRGINESSRDEIVSLIPDQSYRMTVVKLVRNITPDGKRVNELELGIGQLDSPTQVVLRQQTKENIREILKGESSLPKADVDGEAPIVEEGILRALHLDKKWLEIVKEDGEHITCSLPPSLLLDDVIGPMVNRSVTATGHQKLRYRRSKFILTDIELT